ncbi:MAG: hypothetical protein V3U88_02810 [Methylococcales bacterium]
MIKNKFSFILVVLFCTNMNACASRTDETEQNSAIIPASNTMSDFSFYIETTQAEYKLGDPVFVKATLMNHSPEQMQILIWGTPLERTFSTDLFHVSKKGVVVPYIGRMITRGVPKNSDYLSINPEKSLTTIIDISKGYSIKSPGTYTITMNPRYLSIRSESANDNLLKAESNTIVIQITE